MKTCSKKGCSEGGTNRSSAIQYYCDKHYRFKNMKGAAHREGKVVPTDEQLEEMLIPCIDQKGFLVCPRCQQSMQWRVGTDRKVASTISLQHNHDTSMEFCCHSCNIAHGNAHLKDDHWLVEPHQKYCPACKEIKNKTSFSKNAGRNNELRSICRTCSNAKSQELRKRKRKGNAS